MKQIEGRYRLEKKLEPERPRAYDTYVAVQVAVSRVVLVHLFTGGEAAIAHWAAARERWSRLDHPSLVSIFDGGVVDGMPYLVTAFVEGETLSERLAHGGASIDDVKRALAEVAAVVEHARARGVLLADPPPDRVVFAGDRIFVTDLLGELDASSVTTTVSSPLRPRPAPADDIDSEIMSAALGHRRPVLAFVGAVVLGVSSAVLIPLFVPSEVETAAIAESVIVEAPDKFEATKPEGMTDDQIVALVRELSKPGKEGERAYLLVEAIGDRALPMLSDVATDPRADRLATERARKAIRALTVSKPLPRKRETSRS